jgi:hypothetical protein
MTSPTYEEFHTAVESTGEYDRVGYYACQCTKCGCDRDPVPGDVCTQCQAGEHVPCAPDCAAAPPHIPGA